MPAHHKKYPYRLLLIADEKLLLHCKMTYVCFVHYVLQHDSIPWRRIVTSAPVNALNVCNFGRSFVFFFLLTNEPLFLNVFGYKIAEVISVLACDKTSAFM